MAVCYSRTGRGPAVLLLHGLGTSRHIWQPLTGRLAVKHDIVAVDLPGFGDSPPLPTPEEPSPATLAAAVAALLNELDLSSAHLVGNSLGGWVALELAKRGYARSLALVAPAGLWWSRPPRAGICGLQASHRFVARAAAADSWARQLLATPAGRAAALAPFVARPHRVPTELALAELHRFGTSPGFLPTLRALARRRFTGGQDLTVPVSVTFGSHDWILPTRLARYRDELPTTTWWQTVPGWGHVPTYDDPDGVTDFVLTALAR